jgi:palmitoyl transferase
MATMRKWLAVVMLLVVCALPVHAQTSSAKAAEHSPLDGWVTHPNPFVADDSARQPLETLPWLDCAGLWSWVGRQCAGLKGAWYQGRATAYVSGYAWHLPGTWEEARLKTLNSRAWGGGYGFARTDEHGDGFGWYALAFRDSHFKLTTAVGWSAVTYWPTQADVSVGLGYTVFLMTRPDIASGWPFPAALPIASVKLGQFEVLGTFIPKLNGGINHGDVAYFFARYQF